MYPTLLDLDTGQTHTLTQNDASVFQWCENNYACDCNRGLFVGRHRQLDEEAVARFAGETEDACVARRFVIVDVHGDLEGHTPEELVALGNWDYPIDAQRLAQGWRTMQEEAQTLRRMADQAAGPATSVPARRPERL